MQRELEKHLKQWKTSHLRYPLILRGARQVGKTYLVEKFGREEFESFVPINFEALPQAAACFEGSLDPSEILLKLESILKVRVQPGKTLLFFDEIQACPRAIVAMRYFKEKLPQLHLIAAGSLLEFALIEGKYSFPVGRVQFMYLQPLTFVEYVNARGFHREWSECLASTLQNRPSEEIHLQMLQLLKEYFLIGGMPAAAQAFCLSHSLEECSKIQEILLATFKADFSKYATENEQKYLRILFEGIPQTLGQQFKFSKIDPHIKSRELKTGLEQLEGAGLIRFIHATSAVGIPLSSQLKRSQFKLLFLDIGLAQHALKIDPQAIFDKDLTQINKGAIAEQFVGQELLGYNDPHLHSQLFFWQREHRGSDAEVDYVICIDQTVIPIEVKSGQYGRLKSLHQFMSEKKSALGIRISHQQLSFENQILTIPFYLIQELPRLVKSISTFGRSDSGGPL